MDHHAQSGTEHAEQRLAEARELLRQSQAEAERLRHQLQSAQRHAAGLSERRRAAEAQTQTAARNNRRMVELLEATRAEITTLKENLDAVTHPPFTFATLEAVHAPREPEEGVETGAVVRGGADVVQNGRRLRVTVSPLLDAARLTPGAQVLLDESSSIVGVAPGTGSGQLLRVKEALPDGGLVLAGTADEERVVRRAPALEGVDLRHGDAVTVDARVEWALRRVELSEVDEVLLEEVPDVTFEDIGGLGPQIERIRTLIEPEPQELSVHTDVLDGVLRHLGALLHADGVLDEQRFWGAAAEVLDEHRAAQPELWRGHDLFREDFAHSCLNRLQLRDPQSMVSLTDPLGSQILVGRIRNPLAQFRGVSPTSDEIGSPAGVEVECRDEAASRP